MLRQTGKLHKIVPALTVLAALAIIVMVLFLPPYIGMEDNGDFQRVTYAQGLYDLPENSELLYNGYYIKDYGIMQYFNEYGTSVYSSQFLFIHPAIWLDKLFTGNDEVFDLRYLAAVLTVYFMVVLYFFVDCLTDRLTLVGALLIGAIVVFVFLDTGYTAYFSSFYAEPVAFISLLACLTSVLLYIDGRYNPFVLLAAFLVNGMVLTFSKQQFAPIGVLLGIMIFLFFKKERGRVFKTMIFVFSAALIATGALTYLLISESFTNINMYHAMTRGVIMTSEDPAETLETFDIDTQYELLDGTIYFDKYPEIDPEDQLLIDDFYSHYNVVSIIKYYAENPNSFFDMLKLAAKSAYRNRPSMGNYEASAGYPADATTSTFSLYSDLKLSYTPKTLGFIVIWTALMLALLYKKPRKLLAVLGLITIGFSQIVVSIIGAGDADLAKHIFLYNVAFDMVSVVVLANVIRFFDKKYRFRREKRALQPQDEANTDQAIYKNT
ncbi:MAG TPA: hypothetical protein P5075_00365 [Eubacteriales bacterium]|nr:hypothetical protein [Eubacteriales bacterium]